MKPFVQFMSVASAAFTAAVQVSVLSMASEALALGVFWQHIVVFEVALDNQEQVVVVSCPVLVAG